MERNLAISRQHDAAFQGPSWGRCFVTKSILRQVYYESMVRAAVFVYQPNVVEWVEARVQDSSFMKCIWHVRSVAFGMFLAAFDLQLLHVQYVQGI